MFYIRLIIYLFIIGSLNVLALSFVYTLPALQDFHQHVLAVTAGLLLMADAILLYLLVFWLRIFGDKSRYREFEDVLRETTSGDEPTEEEFERAVKKWEDRR